MNYNVKILNKIIRVFSISLILIISNCRLLGQVIKSSSGIFQFEINDTYVRLESKHPNNEFTYVNTDTFSMIINVRPNSGNGTVEMYDSLNNSELEVMFKMIFNSPQIIKKGKIPIGAGKAAYFQIETAPVTAGEHNYFILYYIFHKSKQISITFSAKKERSKKIINNAHKIINTFRLI